MDSTNIPLHLQIQSYINAVQRMKSHYPNQPTLGDTEHVAMCDDCNEAVIEYDDHATGCPMWGAKPEDMA